MDANTGGNPISNATCSQESASACSFLLGSHYQPCSCSLLFMAGNGTLLPSSASSSQLARESQIMEEVHQANLCSRNYFRKWLS